MSTHSNPSLPKMPIFTTTNDNPQNLTEAQMQAHMMNFIQGMGGNILECHIFTGIPMEFLEREWQPANVANWARLQAVPSPSLR